MSSSLGEEWFEIPYNTYKPRLKRPATADDKEATGKAQASREHFFQSYLIFAFLRLFHIYINNEHTFVQSDETDCHVAIDALQDLEKP